MLIDGIGFLLPYPDVANQWLLHKVQLNMSHGCSDGGSLPLLFHLAVASRGSQSSASKQHSPGNLVSSISALSVLFVQASCLPAALASSPNIYSSSHQNRRP